MKNQKGIVFLVFLISLFLLSCKKDGLKDSDQIIYEKVDSLLSVMSTEEKVGQMLNLGFPALLQGDFYSMRDTLIFDTSKVNLLLVKYGAGCIQNLGNFPLTPQEWRYYIGYIQDIVQEKTRLKIPVIYGIDAVHGANYTAGSVMFPHQINLAATFEPEWAYEVAEVTAYEVKASTTFWNYSPVLDVARHPLWGRMYETFGEDTYVVQEMGRAMIAGMQGNNPSAQNKILACGKHFLGYGASYSGKDRSPVILPEAIIRQIHLPPFQKAIDEGLLSIMLAAGTLNGVPSHADHWLITQLLKEELSFKGVVLGDWGEIDNLYAVHKVASDEREAVKISVLAGIDMCMEPYDESFAVHLIDLVNDGEVPESRVNDAVRRILYLKYKSGVFEDPMLKDYDYPDFASEESHVLSLQVARESITLLKNEKETLPISEDLKVLVTGVSSNSLNYLNGGWSRTWSGEDTSYNDTEKLTILKAIQKEIGLSKVFFSQGTDYTEEVDIEEAVNKATHADVIIACIGEKPAAEKPSDIEELDLPDAQISLIKELAKTGKPIVLVMVQGRPRIIREIEPLVDAVLMTYLPGNEGGRAITDVLYGNFNPCGKLPYTYPRFSGSLWTYDHTLSDERDIHFKLNGFTPQYEFGFGLSYTKFEYSEPKISADTLQVHKDLTVEVQISNTGSKAGREVVLLFISDEVASISPSVKQLRKFKKIELPAGHTQTVSFTIDIHDLMFVNGDNEWVAEPGYYTVSVGDKEIRFYLDKD
ncbi:Beta-glucosidase BoGH3B [subsurface metagenome]